MTNKEAIRILRDSAETASIFEIAEAVDMAIEALKEQRPHGEWIRIDKWVDEIYVGGFIHKDCPMIKVSDDCLYAPWEYKFCPNCGADMRKEGDSDA